MIPFKNWIYLSILIDIIKNCLINKMKYIDVLFMMIGLLTVKKPFVKGSKSGSLPKEGDTQAYPQNNSAFEFVDRWYR